MSKQNNGWIKMSERKPTDGDLPVLFWNNQDDDYELWSKSDGLPTSFRERELWKPATLPSPPAKEMGQRDEDEHEFQMRFNGIGYDSPLHVWQKALAYRDAQNRRDMEAISMDDNLENNGTENDPFIRLRKRCGLAK